MASPQQQADDWEQAADTEQQNLTQQTSRMNINSQSFRPQANTFVPSSATSAQPFYPQQHYQYPQPQPQPQPMYSAQQIYPHYGQPQYGYQQQGGGGYVGGYGAQYGGQQQPPQFQPQVLQRGQPAPVQAKKENGINPSFTRTLPTHTPQTLLTFLHVETPKSSGLPSLPPPRAPITGNPSATAMPGKSTASTGPAKVLKIGTTTASPKPIENNETLEKKPQPPSKPIPAEEIKQVVVEPKELKEKKSASKPPSGQNSAAPSVNDDESESRDGDALIKDQEELDERLVQDMYGKEHVNIVFIGHVDAGKSTLGGNILYLTGMVDERTMEKYEKEAREAGRESWYLSWALDTSKEERNKGKTVEVGRARFETEKRRYTILDAPGHKSFVPNMISGAAQADVGVLVISARKGEFETGFDKGGQTREHAVLAKMQGINKLVIVINKMDDPTVEWSKER
jgi:peptide chain release factor subunit 3